MSNQNPTIVFVPGAWHIPAHYEPILKRLREAGFEVSALRHPSCTVKSDPGDIFREDAKTVADTIRPVLQSGKDAVVIMHSYGGVTGPEGTAIVCEKQKSNPDPKAGRVRRLVFLAAHMLEKGVSFEEARGQIPNLDISEDGMMVHRTPAARYYNDVSAEDAQPALDMLVPMAHSAMTTRTQYAGWKDYGIPCTYIKCLKDTAVVSSMWDEYLARAKDAGVEMDAEELDTSHSPFWSAPDALFEVLKRVIH